MDESVPGDRIRGWIDDDLVTSVDSYPDQAAELNYVVELSNLRLHVIRREPDGPVLIGQQIEYGSDIRSRIQELSPVERNSLVARIRETLTAAPVVYGFHDEHGQNVPFEDVHRIFVELRIYPDALSQHELMRDLIDVWKVMRYLDDLVALLDAVERR